jgi:hypothetical protein
MPMIAESKKRRWSDAGEDRFDPLAPASVVRGNAGHHAPGGRRQVEAPLSKGEGRKTMRIRRIAYSLAWLAALAVAIGAGWKPN